MLTFGVSYVQHKDSIFFREADLLCAEHKTHLVTFSVILYGALPIPSYWLTTPTLANFNALFSLYVVFGIVTSILIALLNIYIPYCMRAAVLFGSQAIERAGSSHAQGIPEAEMERKPASMVLRCRSLVCWRTVYLAF